MVFQSLSFTLSGFTRLEIFKINFYRLRAQALFKSREVVAEKELTKPQELKLDMNGSDSGPR